MSKPIIKRIALAGFLLLLLLGLSGCFSQPDPVDALPTGPLDSLRPFETATVPPTAAPTQPGWDRGDEGEGGGEGVGGTGTSPTTGVITASPPPATATAAPTVTPTQDTTLRNGSEGDAVKTLQQRLKDLGYYTGSVDGKFGGGTETALKEFQRVNGLTADGVAGARTMSTINSSSAKPKPKPTTNAAYATNRPALREYTPSQPEKYGYLQLGSSGNAVTKLQNRLKELGYYKGTVSGTYDEATEAAVRAFQERNGEWVDGVAGEDTQIALYGAAALPAASGSSAVPFTGYRTLKSGVTGEDVELLQSRLMELGYFAGAADGTYGETTAKAVAAFQVMNGLTEDGVAGSSTQARIYSPTAVYAANNTAGESASAARGESYQTLEKDSVGDDVYRLQERLYDLGYYSGRIDGVYSEEVADAVRAFQRANKLSADGKAGRSTQARLYSDEAIAAVDAGELMYATLRQGDEGERVRALQGLLATYGYFTVEIDGRYLDSTTAAVRNMQASNALQPDGVAGPATQQLLYQGSPVYAREETAEQAAQSQPQTTYQQLRQGSSGPDVTMMQQFLQELGYPITDESGTYGATTFLAVQAFQEQNNLPADGVAGQETLALLYTGRGAPAEVFDVQAALAPTPERDKMQSGDEGQDVFTLQERLVTLGYLNITPDGKYGESTKTAVTSFQRSNGLKEDGVAGKQTVTAMYAADAVPAIAVAGALGDTLAEVSNRERELAEQDLSGAIQASLSGGGIAVSYNSNLYYVGKGGTLYRSSGGNERQAYDGKASFIHASDKGVTFVSGNKILRIESNSGKAKTLATASGIQRLSIVGNTLFYLDGSGRLMRQGTNGDATEIAKGVNDFAVDIYQYTIYLATDRGVLNIAPNGSGEQMVSSTPADQVQIVDAVVFYRAGGTIYRVESGISVRIADASASWMAVYRDKLYFIAGGILHRSDTDGKNSEVLSSGGASEVSFVSGKAYVAAKKGGPVTEVLELETDIPDEE